MTAFEFFIKDALRSEHLNQVILYKLLHDTRFVKLLMGLSLETVVPCWEPEKGLFDLGLKTNKASANYLALIELKTDSLLSDAQAKRQAEKLLELCTQGFHIFVGLSDFEYLLSNEQDHLNDKINRLVHGNSKILPGNGKVSHKIGYKEMIAALNNYGALPDLDEHYREISVSYSAALQENLNKFEDGWKRINEPKDRAYFYAAYALLRGSLPELIAGRIYSVGNTARSEFIINFGAWWYAPFNGYSFEIFHEINNGRYRVLAISYSSKDDPHCPPSVRKQFQTAFVSKFEKKLQSDEWSLGGSATKYMKLAEFKKPYSDGNIENTEYWTALIVETHKILTDICTSFQITINPTKSVAIF